MKNNYFFYLFSAACCALSTPAHSVQNNSFLFSSNAPKKVEVNNRILAVVDGKPISVYDLMKKLDVIFYKQYPQYAEFAEAKFQFYQFNWKATLRDLIDKQLILADAKEVKLPVTGGDVRQEMETLFGPNIISNLDRLGMSYEEAYDIVQGDITLRRMIGARVSNKAQRKVTPQTIIKAYEEYSKNNIHPAEWDYRILSVRNKDAARAAEVADIAYNLLSKENVAIGNIEAALKKMGLIDQKTIFSISEPLHHTEKEISEMYKSALAEVKEGSYSRPQAHDVKKSKEKIYRIFYVAKHTPSGAPPFAEVEAKLIADLRNQAMETETNTYLTHLRKHFYVDEKAILSMLPEDYQPFVLH